MQYIEVILPLRLTWTPSYSCENGIKPGQRVQVRFSGRKYIGVVRRTGITPDVDVSKVQPILEVVEGLAPVTEEELHFWDFLASYYLCTIGEVYKAAYPNLKVNSEKIAANTMMRAEAAKERTHAAALATARSRIERLKERLSRKEAAINARKEGTKGRAMLEAERERIISELRSSSMALASLESIRTQTESHGDGQTGITASKKRPLPGKPLALVGNDPADIYVQHLQDNSGKGFQALVLAPEIAALKALEAVLEPLFPDELEVFHSGMTAAGKRKVADAVRKGSKKIVLGTRSALFLPFNGLGLVIIHEEQDTWYKQTEPAPRYHGRDAAVMLAGIHGAQALLGSSSPSLETLLNVRSGKYRLLPDCDDAPGIGQAVPMVIDIGAERRKNGMTGMFSRILTKEIMDTSGTVTLLRGWEKEAEVISQAEALMPGRDIRVMTLSELKREGAAGSGMIAVLQADALVSKDDFRADERARQLVSQLQSLAPKVLIQTAVAERFDCSKPLEGLLKERKDFGYPPFTRMLDVTVTDSNPSRLALMASRLADTLDSTALQVSDDRYKLRFTFMRDSSLAAKKKSVMDKVCLFETEHRYAGHIVIDVDPI